jgi:hypothetical protein
MNFNTANTMLARLSKVLSSPTQVPSPAALMRLMSDYVVPILQEVIARSVETTQAVVNTNELAQTAFVTARQTLAGDLMSNIADSAMNLRELLATALPEGHAAFELLDQIDGNLATFEEYLLDGEDEEGGGDDGEGGDGEEGEEEGLQEPLAPLPSVPDAPVPVPQSQEQSGVSAAEGQSGVIDVPAEVTTTHES